MNTTDWLEIVAGLRFDYNDTFESRLSPRGALILHPYDGGTLKLLYSQGFRNPSPYEAFFQDGIDIADNPDLRVGEPGSDHAAVVATFDI